MQRAQKMEAVGQLTTRIVHDFNNILACAMGYTDLALSRCVSEDQGKLNNYLQQVYRASERGRDLVSQMLSFSREGGDEAVPMDPQPIVEETVKMLRSTLPASVVVGDFVELAVSDSGEGIESLAMEKLFEPFYTTKEVGKGTGLGLSVVHGIVHEHGGHIKVESTPSKGSIFRLFFPTACAGGDREQKNMPGSRSAQVPHVPAGQRILLVDDEQAVVGFIKETLEAEGFVVEGYSDSQQALADFQQDPHRFDLVITDLTMPGLLGTELARELHLLRADIPALLCSGFSGVLNMEDLSEHEFNGFLAKPFDRVALLESIDELLNERQKEAGL